MDMSAGQICRRIHNYHLDNALAPGIRAFVPFRPVNDGDTMGLNSVYIAIDEARLDKIWDLEDDAFRENFIEEIEGDEGLKRLAIDKIWDALHCTLTGSSASAPVEGDPLSEAIVGVYPRIYDDEDYSVFVSVIDQNDLPRIIEALEAVDTARLEKLFDPAKLKRKNVYPQGIWMDEPANLIRETATAVQEIRDFLVAANQSGDHVLATIF